MSGYWGVDAIARSLITALTPGATLPAKPSGARSAGTAEPAARIDHQHGSAIVGVTDGSSSAAGDIGEYLSVLVPNATKLAVAAATPTNLCSLVLTPGKWEIDSHFSFIVSAGNTGYAYAGVNNVSGVVGPDDYSLLAIPGSIAQWGANCPKRRFNVTVPTTIYLIVYSAAAANYSGEIIATRVG